MEFFNEAAKEKLIKMALIRGRVINVLKEVDSIYEDFKKLKVDKWPIKES